MVVKIVVRKCILVMLVSRTVGEENPPPSNVDVASSQLFIPQFIGQRASTGMDKGIKVITRWLTADSILLHSDAGGVHATMPAPRYPMTFAA